MENMYQCRLCLQMVSSKIDIFKDDFPKMIEILTSIKVIETDDFPKQSCFKCAKDVKAALLTRKRIIKSYKKLVEELMTKKTNSPFIKEFCNNRPGIKITPAIKGETEMVSPKRNSDFATHPLVEQSEDNSDENIACENATDNKEVDIKVEKSESSTQAKPVSKNSNSVKVVPEKRVIMRRRIVSSAMNNSDIIRRLKKEQIMSQLASLERPRSIIFPRKKVQHFSCAECKLQFTHRMQYNLHMGKHKKSKCDICGKLIRSDNFKKHVAMHSDNPVVCDICGAKCKNSDSLRGHHFYYHKCTASQYVCDQCGRGFRQRYKFLLHKTKEHGGDRNFKCETCGKAFFTKLNLNSHVNMTHKKLRPHICEYCGKGFSGKYALKTHTRQHTNEAPYTCEFCDEGFRQKVSLKAHLKSKHGFEEENRFFCGECQKGFATVYALKIHQRLHLMKKCEHCNESFAEQTYLTNHIKDAHSDICVVKSNESIKSNEDIVEEQLYFECEPTYVSQDDNNS